MGVITMIAVCWISIALLLNVGSDAQSLRGSPPSIHSDLSFGHADIVVGSSNRSTTPENRLHETNSEDTSYLTAQIHEESAWMQNSSTGMKNDTNSTSLQALPPQGWHPTGKTPCGTVYHGPFTQNSCNSACSSPNHIMFPCLYDDGACGCFSEYSCCPAVENRR